MKSYQTIDDMRTASRRAKHDGKRVGFVPTMGALHEGHLSLVRAARERCDFVIVSIFVNPTQFGPKEDFGKYPRTLKEDSKLLTAEKVSAIFAPSVDEMYPKGAATWVEVAELSNKLCGRFRPGHFRGVATVVNKLFNIVDPELAFFGQKDAAQCAVLKKMVRDLAMPVELVVCPIVREPDGLAMSSRNAYLSAEDRKRALVLHRALKKINSLYAEGQQDAAKLIAAGMEILRAESGVEVDYLEIVDAATLDPLPTAGSGALVAVAARVGGTRLIDNILLP